MKNENGAGTVIKKAGKHRRPWVAIVTTGWKLADGKARQIRHQIGAFETKAEAREALVVYHTDPIVPERSTATMAEIYDKWMAASGYKIKTQAGIRAGFRYCEKLHKMVFADIRAAHIEDALKDYDYNAQKRARCVLNHLYDYCIKNDLCEKNYAKLAELDAKQVIKRKRVPFADDEIEQIWKHEGELIADMILIQIYSGWRPAELLTYHIDEINDCMVGGAKTEAGIDRVVPIHPGIRELVYRYKDGFPYEYGWYWDHFKEFTASLGMDHIPHECRHTFSTLAKRAGMNEYILKMIIGHSIKDVTEAVYTHRSIEDLKAEIRKMPCGKLPGQLPEQKVVNYPDSYADSYELKTSANN